MNIANGTFHDMPELAYLNLLVNKIADLPVDIFKFKNNTRPVGPLLDEVRAHTPAPACTPSEVA